MNLNFQFLLLNFTVNVFKNFRFNDFELCKFSFSERKIFFSSRSEKSDEIH